MEKNLRGLFEHERLKCTIIRTNQGNVQNLAELRLSLILLINGCVWVKYLYRE